MLHYVNKTNTDHHVAASWMFLPNEVYDEEACAEVLIAPLSVPLSQ